MRQWIKLVESIHNLSEEEEIFEYHIGGMHYDMGIEGTLEELCARAIKSSQEVLITLPTNEFIALYRGGDLRLANPEYQDRVLDSKSPLPGVFHKANRQ